MADFNIKSCWATLNSYNGIVGDSCFPEILDNNNEGGEVVEIKSGKHPLLTSGDFIPNDVMLSQKVFILTGRIINTLICGYMTHF